MKYNLPMLFTTLNGNSLFEYQPAHLGLTQEASNRNRRLSKSKDDLESSALKIYFYFLNLLWFLSDAMGDGCLEPQRQNEMNPRQRPERTLDR